MIRAPRFAKLKPVGAHFGLTSRRIQSGDAIGFDGHISRCGDGEVRAALYEAASANRAPLLAGFGAGSLAVNAIRRRPPTSDA